MYRTATVTSANEGHKWSELTVVGCNNVPPADSYIREGDDLRECYGWLRVSDTESGYVIFQKPYPQAYR